MIAFLRKLLGRDEDNRIAHDIYIQVVTQARRPAFYLDGAVEDTLDGRFDLIILHLWLVLSRLHALKDGEKALEERAGRLEERILEVHFSDMDQALREAGVGDLGVGKKVKAMAQAFFGRARAYDAAVAECDRTGSADFLREALERNVYRGRENSGTPWLVDYVLRAREGLAALSTGKILEGAIQFPPVAPSGAGDAAAEEGEQ